MNTTNIHFASNKVRDIERLFKTELASLYPDGETRMFVRMLFEAYLGWSYADLLTHRDETVDQSDLLRFHWALQDLKRHRPIQHIIGWTDFCGCRISVNENTLIPRPETEEIVNWTINHISKFKIQNSKFKALDLCTGSGCIAIALAKQWPEAEVTAVDISEKALNIAKHNAEANNVEINFLQADILSQFKIRYSKFDIQNSIFKIIISNPPYVMEKERSAMQPNVLDWEPSNALFVPDADPLLFYRAIAEFATKHLATDGMLVLEINETLGQDTLHLFEKSGFTGDIHSDFHSKARMISLHFQS